MIFPYAPEDNLFELFLGGAWVNVTSDVLNRDGCTITRGYTSERTSGAASPQLCNFTLKNSSGKYSPRNPSGPYYGTFGQNTPGRVSTRVGRDAFGRTVSNDWGPADVGGTWAKFSGAAGDFSVSGGKGVHVVTAANTHRLSYLPDYVFRNVEIRATCSTGVANVTGGVLAPLNLVVGGLSTSDYFMMTVLITTAEVISVTIMHVSGGIIASSVNLPFPNTGQTLAAAFQMEGQTLRGKVWDAAGDEPYDWTIEGSFAFDVWIDRAPGWVGIRSATGTGNTNVPVTFSYDDFEIRINRFHGEASSWPTEWDTSGNDVYVPLQLSGVRRRLSQGQEPLISPYTRANAAYAPAHILYYPIEDESGSTSIASGLPNRGPMRISGPGTPTFASESTYQGSAPFGKPNQSRWMSPKVSVSATGEIQMIFLLSVPSTGETDLATFGQIVCSGTIGFVDCFYHTGSGGDLELRFYNQAAALISGTGTMDVNVDGQPMLVSVQLVQNGANVDWTLAWLNKDALFGATYVGTVAGQTIGAPRALNISPYTQVGSSAIGHAILRNNIISIFTFAAQLRGYEGEFAQERIARLCLENDGINNTFIRSSILDGTAVGVQGRKTMLDLLDEAVTADLGYLHESRDIIGFVHRYGRSLYNQDAVLTLDYAAGQVQPPFGQVDDDQLLLNDFTAKRDGGSAYQATKTTGPLSLTSPTSGQGVGRYDDTQTYVVAKDNQLPDIATWKVHLGTYPDPRYPRVTVNLAKLAATDRQQYLDALAVNLHDRIEIINPKESVINGTISQIAPGYTERMASKQHEITFVCIPGVPFEVAEAAGTTGDTNPWLMRADTDGSTVNTLANAGATSLSVATTSGPLWSTVSDDYPLYLDVAGLKVRATACSGASSPQTFTVDALPVARAAGLSVSVWHLPVLAQ